MGDGAGERN